MNNEEIRELLAISHKIMRYSHNKENFGNIPRREFFVMAIVRDYCREKNDCDKGITVTKIANILSEAPANMSRLLRNMEDKGYIFRIFDDNDRRAVYIRLSEKGEKIIINAREKIEERYMKIFEKMGEKEFDDYLELSRKLLEIIIKEI